MIYPAAFNTTTGPLHWDLVQRARAVDNQIYVGMCSPARATEGDGYKAWGHSSLFDPMCVSFRSFCLPLETGEGLTQRHVRAGARRSGSSRRRRTSSTSTSVRTSRFCLPCSPSIGVQGLRAKADHAHSSAS